MTALINITAILVFAAVVAGAVYVGLRLFFRAQPSDPPVDQRRRPLLGLLGGIALAFLVILSTGVATAFQTSYGAPVGHPAGEVLEVVEVGECRRPVLGFGVVRSCEVTDYRSDVPEPNSRDRDETIKVVGGDPVAAGDRVARYWADGWERWLQLFAPGGQWRSIADEERPNLVWLPTAALLATGLAVNAAADALRRRHLKRAADDPA